MPVIVRLGNAAPLNPDGSLVDPEGEARGITELQFPHGPGDNDAEIQLQEKRPEHKLKIRGLEPNQRTYYVHLCEVEQAWVKHHGGDGPDWVESDDPVLAELLGEVFNCPVGMPEGWDA